MTTFYKNEINFLPYFSAITSDLAFVMEDCIINIDAKTVDLDGNEGDADDISVLKNQITWKHKPLYNYDYEHDGQIIKFAGMRYDGNQKPFENKLPCLTFILKLILSTNFFSYCTTCFCTLSFSFHTSIIYILVYQHDNMIIKLISHIRI